MQSPSSKPSRRHPRFEKLIERWGKRTAEPGSS
jgi:hypothetical protein